MAKKKTSRKGKLGLTRQAEIDYVVDIRKVINDRLAQLGKKPYWLWRQIAPRMSKQGVYQYLSGKNETNTAKLELMMAALGIEFRIKDKT